MTSIALCIPTYQRHECVNEFLCEYAGYYQKYGIDIYYYDSSPDLEIHVHLSFAPAALYH